MTDKNILMRQKKDNGSPRRLQQRASPHTRDVGRCRHGHTSRTMAARAALSAGMGSREKSVADRSAQRRSTPQSINGNGVPHKKARPRHAQGIGVCLPALVRSGSGCRFHRISAVVAKCEGCYSKVSTRSELQFFTSQTVLCIL